MVGIAPSILFSASLLYLAAAVPMEKRIAQTIAESTAEWEQACIKAANKDKKDFQICNPTSQKSFMTLLAAAGPCEQQDKGDDMIDLAKTFTDNEDMIRLTQLFVQQPRNAPDSFQVPHCQKPPKNKELNGLFHCQFAGSKFPKFSGDQTGNVPLGLDKVDPPGSCLANPDGPIPDGKQLNQITNDPGVPITGGENPTKTDNKKPKASSTSKKKKADECSSPTADATDNVSQAAPTTKSFQLENGRKAKALNNDFAKLTPDSSCKSDEDACIDDKFAKCVNGKFQLQDCAPGTICAALPLVNKPGTSITCTTEADRDQRIKNTGA